MSRAFIVVRNEATPPGNVEVITQLLLNLAESLPAKIRSELKYAVTVQTVFTTPG